MRTSTSRHDHESIYTALVRAIVRLMDQPMCDIKDLMVWSSPVLAFGDPTRSRVATLGINPSNREFADNSGCELPPQHRRLQTLSSLGLDSWSEADATHLSLIISSYFAYFRANPYDQWFRRLDTIISDTNTSFYDEESPACHLDLVPYATSAKWSLLRKDTQQLLLRASANSLGLLLSGSPIQHLILNGSSVVKAFREVSDVKLNELECPEWTLKRESSSNVRGKGYVGVANRIGDVPLDRELKVLGFNHNLQSSFGVTNGATHAIRSWIGRLWTHDTRG